MKLLSKVNVLYIYMSALRHEIVQRFLYVIRKAIKRNLLSLWFFTVTTLACCYWHMLLWAVLLLHILHLNVS